MDISVMAEARALNFF